MEEKNDGKGACKHVHFEFKNLETNEKLVKRIYLIRMVLNNDFAINSEIYRLISQKVELTLKLYREIVSVPFEKFESIWKGIRKEK